MPAGGPDDGAAGHGAETQPDAGHHAPDREGAAPLPAVGKLVREEGDGADEHRAACDALHQPAQDEHGRGAGPSAPERSEAERQHAEHEDAAAAIAVRQGAGGHQHRGAADGVGIHDPLQALEVGVQLLVQHGQDHGHAGNLQAEHQCGKADGGQRQGLGCWTVGRHGKGLQKEGRKGRRHSGKAGFMMQMIK